MKNDENIKTLKVFKKHKNREIKPPEGNANHTPRGRGGPQTTYFRPKNTYFWKMTILTQKSTFHRWLRLNYRSVENDRTSLANI